VEGTDIGTTRQEDAVGLPMMIIVNNTNIINSCGGEETNRASRKKTDVTILMG